MNHLVTGGTGFLGNEIAKKLIERGESVRVLDIRRDPHQDRSIEFVEGSVLDRDCVRHALKNIDVVHHTAAMVPLTKSNRGFQAVNVEGSRIVAEEAAQQLVSRFVHVSSSAVFGAPHRPEHAQLPSNPLDPYGNSKLEGERAVISIMKSSGTPYLVLRPRTTIASGRLGIFQVLFDWIAENQDIYVIGAGTNKIQFIHAEDLINAYTLLLDKKMSGDFNLGTDNFSTIRANLENLVLHAKSFSKVRSLPKLATIAALSCLDKLGLSPLAPWHYLTYGEDFYFDMQPLLDLGWKPKYSNDKMLAQAYDHFIAHRDDLLAQASASPHRSAVRQRMLSVMRRRS